MDFNTTAGVLLGRSTGAVMMSGCTFHLEDAFGPVIPRQCRSFDFTLLFEQAFLSLLPASILILLFIPRWCSVYRRDVKTLPSYLHGTKMAATGCYACIQLALLVISALPGTPRTRLSLPAAVISLTAALSICILSHLEHVRSVRPSALLNVYLLFSTIFDAAQLRTLWKLHGLKPVATLFSCGFTLKLGVLILEAWEKDSFLAPPYRRYTPEATSSVYNRSVFWWLNRLFVSGYRKNLSFEDLYPIDDGLSSKPLAARVSRSWRTTNKHRKHALIWSICGSLKWAFLVPVLPRLAMIGFNYAQPFLINRIIKFVEGDTGTAGDNTTSYGLICAAAIIYTGISISNGRYKHAIFRSLTMLRGALSTLIYEKTLDLRYSALEDTASVTLMSTDVDTIVSTLHNLHEIWASAVEVVIALYLLGRSAGVGCIAPVLLAIAGTIGNSLWVGPEMRKRRPVWNKAVQQRISLTASFSKDMKSLKMMGLTDRMMSLLQTEREVELERSKAVRWMTIWLNIFANLMEVFAKAFVLMTVAVQARANSSPPLSSAEAYTIISLLTLVSEPLAQVLSMIPSLMGCIGLFGRIQDYLLSQTKADDRLIERDDLPVPSFGLELSHLRRTATGQDMDTFVLDESSFGYSPDVPVLHDISTCIKAGTINMVVGPVGSGKTTLLLGLLGEIQSFKGFVRTSTADVAYCQQSAFLPNEKMRNVIIGILPFDAVWYRTVVQACGLEMDILRLANKDQTSIGSRGLTLSGGQCQRLSLARAVYARKSVVLLDDIFSALDAGTEALIFEKLFSAGGLFRKQKTTVILATHAVHHLESADHIIALGKSGHIVEQGSFMRLQAVHGYVNTLTVQAHKSQDCEALSVPEEEAQLLDQSKADDDQGTHVSDDARRIGDLSVYKYYGRYTGYTYMAIFFSVQFTEVSFLSVPELWVQWWTADRGRHTNMYISIMFVFACAAMCTKFLAIWTILIKIIPRSGLRLHKQLLSIVCVAPLAFFARTDAGIILNRFSQDMTIINTQLPIALLQLSTTIATLLWNIALIVYGSYYLVALIPLLAAVVFAIQDFYLRTSRQLRLLDLEMRSPLFTHFTETQQGLVTIRAFKWKQTYFNHFIEKMEVSQQPYYLLYMIQQWLSVCLSLLVAAIATILVAFATQFRNTSSGGAIGVALVNIIGFSTNLAALVSHWTELETSIGVISRLKQLEQDVQAEDLATEVTIPPQNWPAVGVITYDNVSAGYNEDSPAVLHDINLRIRGGEKIGICGRTGSGKSTLISLLFRLLPVRAGTVKIDGLDLASMPRQAVRTSIITIPQEPYLLAGTVRFNAAPHSASLSKEDCAKVGAGDEDVDIISALRRVDLWAIVQARGGLDAQIVDIGLSHGQKQLFCLARAILRKRSSNLLVLDEATSSVDKHTDEVMGKIIKEEFSEHTVISVAHRLSSLVKCDRVVVMDGGHIVEIGDPANLLEVEGGWWRALWDAQH